MLFHIELLIPSFSPLPGIIKAPAHVSKRLFACNLLVIFTDRRNTFLFIDVDSFNCFYYPIYLKVRDRLVKNTHSALSAFRAGDEYFTRGFLYVFQHKILSMPFKYNKSTFERVLLI
jgi:hypothetical protein